MRCYLHTYFSVQSNHGKMYAYKNAVKYLSTPWSLVVDSDDIVSKEMVDILYRTSIIIHIKLSLVWLFNVSYNLVNSFNLLKTGVIMDTFLFIQFSKFGLLQCSWLYR